MKEFARQIRRFKQSLSVLQAKALINQRQVVKVDDIVILENALWETVDQKDDSVFDCS